MIKEEIDSKPREGLHFTNRCVEINNKKYNIYWTYDF